MTKEQSAKKLEFICNQVKFLKSNGFDSIRIFASLHDDEEQITRSYSSGAGNLMAQCGQIKEWVIMQDQYTIEDAKKTARE